MKDGGKEKVAERLGETTERGERKRKSVAVHTMTRARRSRLVMDGFSFCQRSNATWKDASVVGQEFRIRLMLYDLHSID